MTLLHYFDIILQKQEQFGYYMPRALGKPADSIAMEQVEDLLQLKFNDEIKQLYTMADGIISDPDVPYGMTGLIPVYSLLSLSSAIEYYQSRWSFEESFYNWEYYYKPGKKLFPFLANNAGDCYWVNLNEGTENNGKIYFTNTLGEFPDYHYDSLTSMFKTIAECYQDSAITIDKEGYLDCDYELWGIYPERNNPGLAYWKTYNN